MRGVTITLGCGLALATLSQVECGLQVGGRPQGPFPGSLKRPLLLLYLILRSFLNQNIFDILASYLGIVGIESAGPLYSMCTCAPAPRRRFLRWRLPGEAELEGGHVVQADSGLHNWCTSNFPKQNGPGRGWLELITPAIIVVGFRICQWILPIVISLVAHSNTPQNIYSILLKHL